MCRYLLYKHQKTTLSQHQKFHKANLLAQELASLASEVGMTAFERRLDVMKSLKESWSKGKDVAIVMEEDEDQSGTCMNLKSIIYYFKLCT